MTNQNTVNYDMSFVSKWTQVVTGAAVSAIRVSFFPPGKNVKAEITAIAL